MVTAVGASCAVLMLLFASTAAAHSGDKLDDYGTATVDGVVSNNEYADCTPTVSQTAGAVSYQFRICETNDEDNDYYAVEITDATGGTPDTEDSAQLWFDEDHDGTISVAGDGCPYADPDNEDWIGWLFGIFNDGYYCRQSDSSTLVGWDGPFNGTGDHDFGATTLGAGSVFEFSHPLDSGDADDYSLAHHDTVGWCFTYDDEANSPPNNPGFAFGEIQYPPGCFVDFSNQTLGLVRGDSTNFGDVFKLNKLDELLEKLKNKLKQYVAGCKPCPPDPTKKLLEKVNEAIKALKKEKQGRAVKALDAFVELTQEFIGSDALPQGKAKKFVKKGKSFANKIDKYEAPGPAQPLPPPGAGQRPIIDRAGPNG